MSRQEFYFLTLVNGLKKLVDICNEYNKYMNITTLEQLIQDNEYFQSKKELIYKLCETGDNDIYKILLIEAEKILEKGFTKNLQDKGLLLEPIFNKIFVEKKDSNIQYFYQFKPMSLKNIFPKKYIQNDIQSKIKSLNEHLNNLKTELKNVDSDEKLFYLLEKYLWCIPIGDGTISLLDYTRSLSCIALSLYEQNRAGEFQLDSLNDKEHFLLINGDISGIQDFIFNISSKGAAKSLKGRSVYLNLLLEIILKYIIDELELYETNIIYSGGGNFYIIAPVCKKKKLENIRINVLEKLLAAHNGEIYVALSWINLKPSDFNDFTNNWKKVGEKTSRQKRIRWSELDLKNNYEKVFGPFDKGTLEKNRCSVCGISSSIRSVKPVSESEDICDLCNSFRNLTDKLKDAKYISFKRVTKEILLNTYNNIFRSFGYEVDICKELPQCMDNRYIYKLNSTDYLKDSCVGFKFGVYNLPVETDEDENREIAITFEELAKRSINEGLGDKKLGYLKLDVDNLGSIFINGLKENKSIIHVASLSRMLGLFFEGFINELIKELELQDRIYVVFSGGDDTFVIGSWNSTFKLYEELYKKFRKYTCHNPSITFSASLGVYRYNYPVVRAAINAEEHLEKAKCYIGKKEGTAKKNKVSLFGEVFNWSEFQKILEIKNLLVDVIKKEEKRSVLDKVLRSTKGFKKILDDSVENKFDNVRFWRLAYYLREIKDKNSAEQLMKYYREIVIDNLLNKSKNEKIENIMIIPTAVRWAEFETKKLKS